MANDTETEDTALEGGMLSPTDALRMLASSKATSTGLPQGTALPGSDKYNPPVNLKQYSQNDISNLISGLDDTQKLTSEALDRKAQRERTIGMLRGLSNIATAASGAKQDTEGWNQLEKGAGNEVQNLQDLQKGKMGDLALKKAAYEAVKLQDQMDKGNLDKAILQKMADPDSDVSKMYRAVAAKKYGIANIPENVSAYEIHQYLLKFAKTGDKALEWEIKQTFNPATGHMEWVHIPKQPGVAPNFTGLGAPVNTFVDPNTGNVYDKSAILTGAAGGAAQDAARANFSKTLQATGGAPSDSAPNVPAAPAQTASTTPSAPTANPVSPNAPAPSNAPVPPSAPMPPDAQKGITGAAMSPVNPPLKDVPLALLPPKHKEIVAKALETLDKNPDYETARQQIEGAKNIQNTLADDKGGEFPQIYKSMLARDIGDKGRIPFEEMQAFGGAQGFADSVKRWITMKSLGEMTPKDKALFGKYAQILEQNGNDRINRILKDKVGEIQQQLGDPKTGGVPSEDAVKTYLNTKDKLTKDPRPAQDAKIANWAKEHNMPYDAAKKIILGRNPKYPLKEE